LSELFHIAAGALGVDGARVTLAEGDDVHFGRLDRLVRDPSLAGLGSMISMPLQAAGRSFGVLELHWSAAHILTDAELAMATSFAMVAACSIAFTAERHGSRPTRSAPCHEASDGPAGLPHQRLVSDRLGQAVLTAVRRRAAVAVLSVDIDNFKDISDTMGRSFGDLVLAEVARKLRLALRANDTLGRLSGNEFVVICEDLHGPPLQIERWLHALGRRIQRELRRPPRPGEIEVVVSVSVGIAVTTQWRAAEDLIDEAGRAMRRAKERGRKRLLHERIVITADPPSVAARRRYLTRNG
jgi:diguanylate cyclase (GGDEF)-like protein